MRKEALGLILARGGSKGLPGKNRREIAGQPCIQWTIDDAQAARDAGALGRIALSTDDRELARIAAACGVEVVERPAHLADDEATIDDAARHAIDALGDESDLIVLLYGNVPVRPTGLIERAIDQLRRGGGDSLQSYVPVGKMHPWWMSVLDHDGAPVRPWEGTTLNHGVHRRQDLPPACVPDGGVIVVTRRALMHEVPGAGRGPHAFLGLDHRGIITESGAVIDIDSEVDALVADATLVRRLSASA